MKEKVHRNKSSFFMKENVLNKKLLDLKQLVQVLFKKLINLHKKLLIKLSILILPWSVYLIRELNKNEHDALEELELIFLRKIPQKLQNLLNVFLLSLIAI